MVSIEPFNLRNSLRLLFADHETFAVFGDQARTDDDLIPMAPMIRTGDDLIPMAPMICPVAQMSLRT